MKAAPGFVLDELQIARGDILYIAASMDRLAYTPSQTLELLDLLVDRVGPNGTIVMPSFTFRNDTGLPPPGFVFDPRRSPSSMGLLSELFRRREGVRRSAHYWLPICVLGPFAEDLVADRSDVLDPFGPGSAFRRLSELPATLVGLGVSLNYVAVIHVVDAILAPRYPFRLLSAQPLEGDVIGEDGARRTTKTLFVSQEWRQRFRPSKVFEASARLASALRFFNHDGAYVWSAPARVFVEEALELGSKALDRGELPPWLALTTSVGGRCQV